MLFRSALFWNITQRRVVTLYRRFRTTYRSHIQGSKSPLKTLDDGADILSRNVGKGLPLELRNIPEEHRSHISHTHVGHTHGRMYVQIFTLATDIGFWNTLFIPGVRIFGMLEQRGLQERGRNATISGVPSLFHSNFRRWWLRNLGFDLSGDSPAKTQAFGMLRCVVLSLWLNWHPSNTP